MSHYYPIYVDLHDKPVLVVGGGTVALRKVKTLLEHGAIVHIISPKLHPQLEELVDDINCFWKEKEYSAEDLQDEILVFSCTEIEEVNKAVASDAYDSKRLINVVDDPEKCTFILPSILERGSLSIAVSTGGSSPIVARQIRADLEEQYGEAYKDYLSLLRSWRKDVKARLNADQKETFWNRATDGKILELIKNGRLEDAKGVMAKCFQSLLD